MYTYLSGTSFQPEMVMLASVNNSDLTVSRLKEAFKLKYRWVRVERVSLEGSVDEWLEPLCLSLSEVRPDSVTALVSCSSPELAAVLSLAAQLGPLEGVYSVSMKVSERRIERWRDLLLGYGELSREVLEEIFWPSRSDFQIHRIPVLPVPASLSSKIADLLKGGGSLGDRDLAATLVRAGLLDIEPTGRVRATHVGRSVLRGISALEGADCSGEPIVRWEET